MNKIIEGIMEVKNMKPEEYRKQKEEYEKIIKKQITDEEFERLLQKFQIFFQTLYEKRAKGQITDEKFERLLRRQYKARKFSQKLEKFEWVFWPVSIIMGLAIIADWPGPWFPGAEAFKFLGLVIVVLGAGFLIQKVYLMLKR